MKTYFVAGAAAIAMVAGIAMAAPGVRARLGADGSVSIADLQKRSTERFTAIDANKDGQLSREEMQAARPGRGPGGRGPGGRGMRGHGPDGEFGMRGRPGPLFQGADTDHNGAVTQAEFSAQAIARFERLDANHDGQIAGDEAQAVRERVGARMGRMGARRFDMLDSDKNGSVSRAEFNRPFAERITRLDTNKDGKLTRDEFRAGRRRGGGPGMI